MKHLHISHSIFLTKQEIASLSSKPTTIETVGFNIPVNEKSSELKLKEIFCKYLITNEVPGDEIEFMEDGYKLYMADTSKWVKTEETPEDINWFQYVAETVTKIDGHNFFVKNQIIIQDVGELERSTFCENLAGYLNKTK